MKPPDEVKKKLVRQWLRKADSDMGLVEYLNSSGTSFHNAIVFHCQQATEKYLKAFLTLHQIKFPKTHDLEELLDIVETVNEALSESLRDAIILTPYGVELRYPGDYPDATFEETQEAIELTRKVRNAIVNHTDKAL
ncbi:MAG: HEPN domain-containing protein [Candidatus Magnetobacterium sp. LHC-1]|uniref:HEPN domain-containing protein n=1 Tax=Candidatus Magnetobacterium casense TaxID=1455061 RepID=A0ABS6RWS5_9BACT|nr:HEPN domain-containing protein [Candidatus Magnetobacterium casensis]MBF0608004.1 HEPN domain-containing protein [Nitrospirota bacterium]MBV6340795.1 HEPN domain-containing protein [Candidatus Magnetobacterium casensis]